MSKGSKQRPGTGYAENWDRIYNAEVRLVDAPLEINDAEIIGEQDVALFWAKEWRKSQLEIAFLKDKIDELTGGLGCGDTTK